jgi:hypothetical protein
MTAARSGHTVTVLPDFSLFIAGGTDSHGAILATTEIYDPNTEKFSPAAKMLFPRTGHAAGALSDGKILIAGGTTRGGITLASSEDYDPETGEFTRRGNLHMPRARAGVTVLRDGRILVTGGMNGKIILDSAETYDVLNGKWTLMGRMSTARLGHTATLLADGRVLIAGGVNAAHAVLASCEIFDPQTNKFSTAASMEMKEARFRHTSALLPNGKVFIAGGASDFAGKQLLASAEVFDPASKSFSPAGEMNEPRMKMPDAYTLLDGRVLILGGAQPAEIYDSKAGSFRLVTGSFDIARFNSVGIQLMDGSVRIFGGEDASGTSTAKTWIYRP